MKTKDAIVTGFCASLLWYGFEISRSLLLTHGFRQLTWLFILFFGLLGGTAVKELVKMTNAAYLALALAGLNIVTATAAIWAAEIANPKYEFVTPLLRFSAILLRHVGN